LQIAELAPQIGELLRHVIRERGALTVAAFMEIALYHPQAGYYARAARRSGRAGDFFTSVDVGPLFGELLEIQIAEMAEIVGRTAGQHPGPSPAGAVDDAFDLVEAGAGNGRLAADILRAARRRDPRTYDRARLHLVEASPAARAAQRETLAEVVDRLHTSDETLPSSFEGVLLANELLDALPVHQVVMRQDGLREVYVDEQAGRLVTREGPLSTPDLAAYLHRLGVTLERGWRTEISLRAAAWIRDAARRLRRGFLLLIDYGHEARELYSATHAGGTLSAFARHTMSGAEAAPDRPAWLASPGDQDITAHVDFTSVRTAAEAEGLTTLGFLDQTYFLMGLLEASGLSALDGSTTLQHRLALKTLLMPGGLGSTHKVMILARNVGTPSLSGCSYKMRVT
jgi:SAM-dependent MidA family methyltransferase